MLSKTEPVLLFFYVYGKNDLVVYAVAARICCMLCSVEKLISYRSVDLISHQTDAQGGFFSPSQVPTLMKATSDDETPCPGYLFEEIGSILQTCGILVFNLVSKRPT